MGSSPKPSQPCVLYLVAGTKTGDIYRAFKIIFLWLLKLRQPPLSFHWVNIMWFEFSFLRARTVGPSWGPNVNHIQLTCWLQMPSVDHEWLHHYCFLTIDYM